MKHSKIILISIFTFIFTLIGFGIIWCLTTWTRLSMDELVFELSAPLRGVGKDMLTKFLVKCLMPTSLLVALLLFFSRKAAKSQGRILVFSLIISMAFFAVCATIFWEKHDVTDYIRNLGDESTFIEDNYVDAGTVDITFPEKKRNLIYIYLESMELTYGAIENGGGFRTSCIPELEELAKEGECFGSSDTLNGALVPYGTTWTMGAMFAQSTGLPLKISVGDNMMSDQENFFPEITSIGDILAREGYNQELLLGSDANFGGRTNFYKAHGNYTIHDYVYANENGVIPKDYYEFWGYEDEKLFEIAKKDLKELSSKDEPFNLTMLTVDTHFWDGYVCHLCRNEFGDNQYANVMCCSSRQVTGFVRWIQQQDFYENTTIVLCGDHTTMNEAFTSEKPEGYERKTYTVILNSAVNRERKEEKIEYSTLDMFPTTIAALGASISGQQLGLGINLFSGKETYVELYGLDFINREFKKGSSFMDSLADIVVDEETMRQHGWLPDADTNVISYNEETDTIRVSVDNIINVKKLSKVYAITYDEAMHRISKTKMELMPDRSYECDVSLKKLPHKMGQIIIEAVGDKKYTVGELSGYLPLQAHDTLSIYADLLESYDNIAIIMANNGDFTRTAIGSDLNVIHRLGMTGKLYKSSDLCMYCVIDGQNSNCETSEDLLIYDCVLSENGPPVHIESSQDHASIVIDGVDYASAGKGLNIVIYDYSKENVIDSACFELQYKDLNHPRANLDIKLDGDNATITASQLNLDEVDSMEKASLRGVIWDGTHYKHPIDFKFNKDSDSVYIADLDLKGYDPTDIYLEVFLYDDEIKEEYRVIDWNGNVNLLKGAFAEELSYLFDNLQDRVLILSTVDSSPELFEPAVQDILKEHGVNSFLEPYEDSSSFLVIDSSSINEGSDYDDLQYDCSYNENVVSLYCSCWDNKYYSSIMINNHEVCRNDHGINGVVYNYVTDMVEDVFTYDANAFTDGDFLMER
jgi:phosphoglycerol transferase